MNETELQRALRSHADDVVTSPPAWDEIERQAGSIIARRHRLNRVVAAATVIVVGAMAALVASGVSRDDGRKLRAADPGPAITPAPDPTTSVPERPTFDPSTEGIWPLASQTDLDLYEQSGSTEYDTPEGAAKAFLTVYGGMKDVKLGSFSEGEPIDGRRTGRIGATSGRIPGLPMTVELAQVAPSEAWTVTEVLSRSIILDSPPRFATLSSPVKLTGRASAFEGTVNVEVRQDGQVSGQNLGTTFVTGSGDATPGPFEGSISFGLNTQPGGALVLIEHSAEDGSPIFLTVVRIRFAS